MFALVATVIILGGALTWYVASRSDASPTATQPTSQTGNTLEGVLQRINCIAAGAGCSDWILDLGSGKSQGLVIQQDVNAYLSKKVRLTGQYIKTFGEDGPTFFEVESIQVLE